MTATATTQPTEALVQKFRRAEAKMNAKLIERAEEVKMCFLALVSQENLLFVGPPGTGKSLLLDSFVDWCGGNRFSTLLTKYTAPEEIFGPISLKGMKEDVYRRVVAGRLPEADFAYLDEIWKASSAILNTMLRILNERTFDYGDGSLKQCPLKLCVSSSNEWPGHDDTGKEVTALFDRFLIRKTVRPIGTPTGRRRLLWETDHKPRFDEVLTPAELEQATREAKAVPWSDEAQSTMEEIMSKLAAEGIIVGDRRQFKAVQVCKANAWLDGASAVQPEHLDILVHILWDDPIEQAPKAAKVILKLVNPAGSAVKSLLREAEEIRAKVNPKEMQDAATACSKLAEIKKKLAVIKETAESKEAVSKLAEIIKDIRNRAIESGD